MKIFDEYEIKARYLPCLISVMPLVHFLVIFLGNVFWKELISEFNWMLVVTDVSLSLIFVLSLIQLQSGIGKHLIEESVFGVGGEYFPTTDMLLLSQGLISIEQKTILRSKIKKMFNISFPTNESKSPQNARLFAREAVGAVRRFVGKGFMTYQYNIRYGFIRNLIGGFIWGFIGSLGSSIIYWIKSDFKAMSFFIVISITFCLLFLFKKSILNKFAFAYADNLYNDFLVMTNNKKGNK